MTRSVPVKFDVNIDITSNVLTTEQQQRATAMMVVARAYPEENITGDRIWMAAWIIDGGPSIEAQTEEYWHEDVGRHCRKSGDVWLTASGAVCDLPHDDPEKMAWKRAMGPMPS